ncbi:glycine/serine hydroxymethyltransferase [Paenibacillus sp. 2003]|nr:glycine/serine hydroxymethyltransferase [Paenibacillus sp. 2003]
MKHLEKQDKVLGMAVQQELGRQQDTIELIA